MSEIPLDKPEWHLQALREKSGSTQAELAEKTGMSVRTICSLEAGGPVRGKYVERVIRELVPEPEEQRVLAWAFMLRQMARMEPELYALAGAPVL